MRLLLLVVQVHGILMASAWGLILPCGVLVSRYGKAWSHWFAAHRAVQASAATRRGSHTVTRGTMRNPAVVS